MLKKINGATLCFVLVLVSCSVGPINRTAEITPIVGTASSASPAVPSAATAMETPNQPLSTMASYTPAPTYSTTPLASPTPATNLQHQCRISAPQSVEATDLARGLVMIGNWDSKKQVDILGSAGFHDPLFVEPDRVGQSPPYVSPDGKRLAYSNFSGEGNAGTLEVEVVTLQTGEKLKARFENIALDRVGDERWANAAQIVIPLASEGEVFSWIVWSPLTGEKRMLAVELTGVGDSVEQYYVPPEYDPQLKLVIYPCKACGDNEYRVKSLTTGNTIWSVDLGAAPGFRTRPVWSPDGQLVAIVGANELEPNRLWIINHHGEVVLTYTLPPAAGMIAAGDFQWSPDSQTLAFLSTTPDPINRRTLTLAYVSITNGMVIDLCIEAEAPFFWSPDGTRIAYSQIIQSGEPPMLVTVVDFISNSAVQLYDAEGHTLWGWAITPQATP